MNIFKKLMKVEEPIFKRGEMVKIRLDGRKGMIVGQTLEDEWKVRLVANNKIIEVAVAGSEVLVGRDAFCSTNPYCIEAFQPFELEKYDT